jgi:hypothetical protein
MNLAGLFLIILSGTSLADSPVKWQIGGVSAAGSAPPQCTATDQKMMAKRKIRSVEQYGDFLKTVSGKPITYLRPNIRPAPLGAFEISMDYQGKRAPVNFVFFSTEEACEAFENFAADKMRAAKSNSFEAVRAALNENKTLTPGQKIVKRHKFSASEPPARKSKKSK